MIKDSTLRPTNLIHLINIAWKKSFARVDKNQQDIIERGWNPLNYNLLTDPEPRATTTKRDISD